METRLHGAFWAWILFLQLRAPCCCWLPPAPHGLAQSKRQTLFPGSLASTPGADHPGPDPRSGQPVAHATRLLTLMDSLWVCDFPFPSASEFKLKYCSPNSSLVDMNFSGP